MSLTGEKFLREKRANYNDSSGDEPWGRENNCPSEKSPVTTIFSIVSIEMKSFKDKNFFLLLNLKLKISPPLRKVKMTTNGFLLETVVELRARHVNYAPHD